MLKVIAITEINEEKKGSSRKDGKVNRLYFGVSFADPANPFSTKSIKRLIFQEHVGKEGKTATWGAVNYAAIKSLLNKEVDGEIVRLEVEPYTIGEGTDAKQATSYTTVIFKGEHAPTVFKQLGHPVVANVALEAKTVAASSAEIVA